MHKTTEPTVNNSGGGEEDIRLSKARNIFRKINKIWSSAKFSKTTKIRLQYNTLVVPVRRCITIS